MCIDSDDATLVEDGLSRREAMALTVATVTMAAGGAEAATLAKVSERAVDIKTADGICDAVLLHAGDKPAPAVIWFPDGFGRRPAHVDMGKRLAAEGYAVLVINPYYRVRRAPVLPPDFDFNKPEDREKGMKMIAMLDHDAVIRDASSFVAQRPASGSRGSAGCGCAATGCRARGSTGARRSAASDRRCGPAVRADAGCTGTGLRARRGAGRTDRSASPVPRTTL